MGIRQYVQPYSLPKLATRTGFLVSAFIEGASPPVRTGSSVGVRGLASSIHRLDVLLSESAGGAKCARRTTDSTRLMRGTDRASPLAYTLGHSADLTLLQLKSDGAMVETVSQADNRADSLQFAAVVFDVRGFNTRTCCCSQSMLYTRIAGSEWPSIFASNISSIHPSSRMQTFSCSKLDYVDRDARCHQLLREMALDMQFQLPTRSQEAVTLVNRTSLRLLSQRSRSNCIDSYAIKHPQPGGNTWLFVMLPGADGSVLHFRGLIEYLRALEIQILPLDIVVLENSSNVSVLADSILRQLTTMISRPSSILTAYSNAAVVVNLLVSHFLRAGWRWSGLILLDPMYKVAGECDALDRDAVRTKMIATSVIDEEELDEYSMPALRKALVKVFPRYTARFEGFDFWQQIESDIADAFKFPGIVEVPTLLIVARHTAPMFKNLTGGEGCVKPWVELCPQARAMRIDCTHTDVAFTAATLEACVDFVSSVGVRSHPSLRAIGSGRMMRALESMASAQASARKMWEKQGEGSPRAAAHQQSTRTRV